MLSCVFDKLGCVADENAHNISLIRVIYYSTGDIVEEIRSDGGGIEPAIEYTFYYGKRIENHELGSVLFSYISESYQQLRG
jgi:hypothetical protein